MKTRMDSKFLAGTAERTELQPTQMEKAMGRTGLGRKDLEFRFGLDLKYLLSIQVVTSRWIKMSLEFRSLHWRCKFRNHEHTDSIYSHETGYFWKKVKIEKMIKG